MIVRLNAAAARTTNEPFKAMAFNRSFSYSVQGPFLRLMRRPRPTSGLLAPHTLELLGALFRAAVFDRHEFVREGSGRGNESFVLGLNPGSVAWSCVMRKSHWTPSIVSNGADQSIYKVEDDLGRNGRIWPEADSEKTDLETVIADLLAGQYKDPVRVIGFNTAEGWSEDVSVDVAQELRRRCDEQTRDIPFFLQDFVDRYEGRYRDIQLPLPMRLV
jgi:hypothetical protein